MSTTYTINKADINNGRLAIKDESMLHGIILDNVNNLCTDIGSINYTEGYNKITTKLNSLTEPFCDNLVLFKLVDIEECVGKLGCRDLRVKEEYAGLYNREVRAAVATKISKEDCMVQCKLPFPLNSDTQQARGAREVFGKKVLETLGDKVKTTAVLPLKVSLAEVPIDHLLENITGFLEKLAPNNFVLADFDITQDFAGIFNKEECITYLQEEHGFYAEGCLGNKSERAMSPCIIVDNNNVVGRDCLTWLYRNTRQKIYNKFVCQVTSPGVTKPVGHHIIDHAATTTNRLNNTLLSNEAQENGVTRFETTIYNYSNRFAGKDYEPLTECKEILQESIGYFQNAQLFYKVPIANMWSAITNSVKNTLTLEYNNTLIHVYWVNLTTRKVTGCLVNTSRFNQEQKTKLTTFALSACSFNKLPANCLVFNDGEDGTLHVEQSCYFKEGETLFTKQDTLFAKLDVDLNDYGLPNTEKCMPVSNHKPLKINSNLLPHELVELEEYNPVILLSKKQKVEQEEQCKREEFLQEKVEKHTMSLAAKLEVVKQQKHIAKQFETRWDSLEDTEEFNQGDQCSVLAVMELPAEKFPRVGALILNNRTQTERVCLVKGFAKSLLAEHIQKCPKGSFLEIATKKAIAYALPKDSGYIATFTIGPISSYNGNIFRKLERFKVEYMQQQPWLNPFYSVRTNVTTCPKVQEFNERLENEIKPLELNPRIAFNTLTSANELEPGQYTVTHLGVREYRGVERNTFRLAEFPDKNFVDNYWFAKELSITSKQLQLLLKVEDKEKTTPSKVKHRLMYLKPAVETQQEEEQEQEQEQPVKLCLTGRALAIETLGAGTYTINSIMLTTYRNKERYLFAVEDAEGVFVDNYWFTKAIGPIALQENTKLVMEVGLLKTTPQKTKQRVVSLELL